MVTNGKKKNNNNNNIAWMWIIIDRGIAICVRQKTVMNVWVDDKIKNKTLLLLYAKIYSVPRL